MFQKSTMVDIEDYASQAPQYYSENIPGLLEKTLVGQRPGSFLDCGCGDGSLLYGLKKKKCLENWKISAIDLSESRIRRIKLIDPNIHAMVDNVEVLHTVPDQSVDLLVSTQVIEHVDDKKTFQAISRVLKKDGRIYLSTVFKKWYGWYFYRNNGRWVLDPTHLREYYEENQLMGLIFSNGFQVLENQKSLFWFPVADFFVRWAGVANRNFYEKKIVSLLRRIQVPILGYYNWELVLKKL